MIALPYILICFIWALAIRVKDDFEQTSIAFMMTVLVSPVFGKRLYYWFEEYDIDIIRKEKERIARLKEEIQAYDEYLKIMNMEAESNFLKSLSKKSVPPIRKKNRIANPVERGTGQSPS
jgi:predicted enzyme involved in methoxymalonyl-ACP biosynthesis